jgi:hypothetical protein
VILITFGEDIYLIAVWGLSDLAALLSAGLSFGAGFAEVARFGTSAWGRFA